MSFTEIGALTDIHFYFPIETGVLEEKKTNAYLQHTNL